MEADILRLILFLAGVGLILGIYLWDRRKKSAAAVNAVRRAQKEGEPGLRTGWSDTSAVDDDSAPEEGIEAGIAEDLAAMESAFAAPDPDDVAPGEQTAFSFTAEAREDDLSDDRLPRKIIQMNLQARKGSFSGDAIMQAARDVNLVHGPMDIFHSYLDEKRSRITFSMANLLEPGTFDIERMNELSTPGVTLFAQLPGPKDGIALLEEMLAVAQRLAALLDAEIQDETHSDMSKQTIEHLREEVVEFDRQVRLARKKR